jgi:hypothetical protein
LLVYNPSNFGRETTSLQGLRVFTTSFLNPS